MAIDYLMRLDALLAASKADVVAFVPGENMVYFTGLHFHLSERPILCLYSQQGLSFIIPELEMAKLDAKAELEPRPFLWRDDTGPEAAFQAAVQALLPSGKTCALDGQTIRYFEWEGLQRAGLRAENTRDIGTLFLQQRARKAPEEIACLRRAIAISEAALQATMAWARPGHSERQIASRLRAEMLERGAHGIAFLLVLTGEKSGLPHGNTGDRIWGEGEFLLIDFGATYEGYPADITRTFCVGKATTQMQSMFDAVAAANAAARAAAAPGMTCAQLDHVARRVINNAGLGDYFIHRLGHGLGLSIHELPNIVAGNKQALQPGMVFTIEPGVYLPGVGGIRIEDNVALTDDGADVLTTYPRGLQPH